MKIDKFKVKSGESTQIQKSKKKKIQNTKNKLKRQKAQSRVNPYFWQDEKPAQAASSFLQITLEKPYRRSLT